MIHDAKRRHVGIIATTTDIGVGGQILCVALGHGLTVLGLAGGVLQAVTGPLKQTLFTLACESRTDPTCLAFVNATETIVSVEGDGRVYAYEFTEPQFAGSRVVHSVATTGGAVSSVVACEYRPRFVTAARHVVSVFDVERGDAEGGGSARRVVPYAEVHVPQVVRNVALMGDVLCYAFRGEVWCTGLEPRRRDPVLPDEAVHRANCPLSTGSTQGTLDDSYIEVRFRSSSNCVAHRNPQRHTAAAAASDYALSDILPPAAAATAPQGNTARFGRRAAPSGGRDAAPHDVTTVEHVHRDGVPNQHSMWAEGRLNRVAGVEIPHSEHAVLFFKEHTRGGGYTTGVKEERRQCRLLFKHRVDAACGAIQHVALLPSATSTKLRSHSPGHTAIGGARVHGRVLYVAETHAWVASLSGAEICEYVFDTSVKMAFSNATYLFTITQQGVMDVYPIRCESPICAALHNSYTLLVRQQHTAGAGGLKTPRDTAYRNSIPGPAAAGGGGGHHHAPFAHTVQRLQSVPLSCVPRAVACGERSIFLVNPYANASAAAAMARQASGGDPRRGGEHAGGMRTPRVPGGSTAPAGRSVLVDCSPTLRAADRFVARTPSASSSTSSKHLRHSSLGTANDVRAGGGCDVPSGTVCNLVSAAELVQELFREYHRGAVYDETHSMALLYEGYLLLAARVCHLRLAAAVAPPAAGAEVFAAHLEVHNTALLQECVATLLGDMYLKLEQGAHGPSHSHRSARPRHPQGSRDFETTSVRSGTSVDGQSEKDSYWSVYSSSYGEFGGMNIGDSSDLLTAPHVPPEHAATMIAQSSTAASFVLDEVSAGALGGLGKTALGSWVFYACSDRSLRLACTMLRRDHWALLSYLDCVLFAATKPKVLASAAEALPPLLSEEQGNALLTIYSRHAPHKLCSVVWDSWLGRAKGGVACFTAGVAARLLLEACGRVSSASRRFSSSSRLTTTSAHTRSYDGSEAEERDSQENYGVNLWGCTPPREQFVIGLLLLEDGRVGGTVESWGAIDGTALTELASSSRHLWEPDVYGGDTTEDALCAILADTDDGGAAAAQPGALSMEALSQCLGAVDAGLAEPSPSTRTLTMGTLLALYFPWLLVPALIAARAKFSIPITSCLRLLKRVPPSCQRQGLLLSRFLQSELQSDPPRLARVDRAVRTYAVCHMLCEMLVYSEQCISNVHASAPPVDDEVDDYDEDEVADGFLGVMQGLTLPGHSEEAANEGKDAAGKSPVLLVDGHGSRAGSEERYLKLEAALKPVTTNRFIDMAEDVQQLRDDPGVDMDPALLPGWVSGLTLEPFSGTMVDAFMASLVLTGDEQSVAAYHFTLRSLQCLLWRCGVADAICERIVATAHRLVRGDQLCESKIYGDGVISLAVLSLVKRTHIDESLVLLEGIFPPAVILSFAVEHCGADPQRWRGLVARLAAADAINDNRYFLTKVLEYLSVSLPLAAFVSLLPPDGNARFFLPFITRAVDIHKAAELKQMSLSLIDPPPAA